MLQIANNGATKTRIMYGAYLSYSQVKEYLSFLIQRGLLQYEEDRSLYTLTEKGMSFLRAYEQIDQMIALGEDESGELESEAKPDRGQVEAVEE